MPDVTASNGAAIDFIVFLGIFIHNLQTLMSELLNLHQTFTYCISHQCTYFGMSNAKYDYRLWQDL